MSRFEFEIIESCREKGEKIGIEGEKKREKKILKFFMHIFNIFMRTLSVFKINGSDAQVHSNGRLVG